MCRQTIRVREQIRIRGKIRVREKKFGFVENSFRFLSFGALWLRKRFGMKSLERVSLEVYSPTSDLFRVYPESQFNGHFEIGIIDSNILTDENKECILANVFIDPYASEGLSS